MDESLRRLRRPVVVAAFEGWNDAADAATDVVNHLASRYPTEVIAQLDSQDYYDFQVTRPRTQLVDGQRELIWPHIQVSICHLPERDLVLVSGPEPNLRWLAFAEEMLAHWRAVSPQLIVLLGAMLTDAPHSRPLPVSASSDDEHLIHRFDLEPNTYEGPTGILGVHIDLATHEDLPVVSLWASVPHYVASSPSPKATLALLARLEDVLDTVLDQGDLPELAKAWERGVDKLAAEDPDIAEYIEGLEQQQDANELPQATGDSIAAEFQRYLRRHDQQK